MTSRQDLVRELDSVCRETLFIKEKGRCYIPDCPRPATDRAHLITCGRLHVRWDTDPDGNCHLLCRQCHDLDHKGLLEPRYVDVYVDKQGEDAFLELRRRAQDSTRLTEPELLTMLHGNQQAFADMISMDNHGGDIGI
jgi:hypothetical protein